MNYKIGRILSDIWSGLINLFQEYKMAIGLYNGKYLEFNSEFGMTCIPS